MTTSRASTDIFPYTTELRNWPKTMDLPMSIHIDKDDWTPKSEMKALEKWFPENTEVCDTGPMITITMANGASLVIVEADPSGNVCPDGCFRGNWEEYHQGKEEDLWSVINVSREILGKAIIKSEKKKIAIKFAPVVYSLRTRFQLNFK